MPNGQLSHIYGALRRNWIERQTRKAVEARWASNDLGTRADGKSVHISLTSYPARFATLALTLKSLLRQTVRADSVLLWIGHKDMDALPADVRALEGHGLDIRPCDDFRSYTKFVHALREFPDARIAICDDDTYYRPQWLETLLQPVADGLIPCHRIHRMRLDANGTPLPYNDWEQESVARDASPLNFPTGVGGILLQSHQLNPSIFDMASAKALCPTADDTWLYGMGRLAGSHFVRVGNNNPLISWHESQHVALWRTNNIDHCANDSQLAALADRFDRRNLWETETRAAADVAA